MRIHCFNQYTTGVQASCYLGLGDQVVIFPSKINRLRFSAQQITEEKQGVQVNDVLFWAINREHDGPSLQVFGR